MRNLLLLLFLCLTLSCSKKGDTNPSEKEITTPKNYVSETESYFKTYRPRLWAEIELIKKDNVTFVYNDELNGPGRAGKNKIELNPKLLKDNPNYPEDRAIIVVWHEYGHVLYGRASHDLSGLTMFERGVANEFAAFKYSVEIAINRAKTKKDFGPLKEVIENLEERSKSKNTEDPHIPAIHQVMKDAIWMEAKSLLDSNK